MVAPFPSETTKRIYNAANYGYTMQRSELVERAIGALKAGEQNDLAIIAKEEAKLNKYHQGLEQILLGNEQAFLAYQDALKAQKELVPDKENIGIYKDLKFRLGNNTSIENINRVTSRLPYRFDASNFNAEKFLEAEAKVKAAEKMLFDRIGKDCNQHNIDPAGIKYIAFQNACYGEGEEAPKGILTVVEEANASIREEPFIAALEEGRRLKINAGAGGPHPADGISRKDYLAIRQIPEVKAVLDRMVVPVLAYQKFVRENEDVLWYNLVPAVPPNPDKKRILSPDQRGKIVSKENELRAEIEKVQSELCKIFPESADVGKVDLPKSVEALQEDRKKLFKKAGVVTNLTEGQIYALMDAFNLSISAIADTKLGVPLPAPEFPIFWVKNVDAVQRFADNQPKAPEVIAYSVPTGMPQELRVPQTKGDGKSSQKTV